LRLRIRTNTMVGIRLIPTTMLNNRRLPAINSDKLMRFPFQTDVHFYTISIAPDRSVVNSTLSLPKKSKYKTYRE
jgi:hypothetical protein